MDFATTLSIHPVSPLMLADRLITLAQDADRAGFRSTAADLVAMVYSVMDGAKPIAS